MVRRLALVGDVSEPDSVSTWCAEERCEKLEELEPLDGSKWEVGFKT